jgi:hypothetical protein
VGGGGLGGGLGGIRTAGTSWLLMGVPGLAMNMYQERPSVTRGLLPWSNRPPCE